MILFVYHICAYYWKVPSVFSYYSTRMLLGALSAFAITLFLGPKFITKLYALKIGHTVRVESFQVLANQYNKKRDIPSMGGIFILLGILIAVLMWMDFGNLFSWILLLTMCWFGGIGGIDDYLKLKKKNSGGISAKKKFFLQALWALLLSAYLLYPSFANLPAPVAKQKTDIGMHRLESNEYARQYYIPFYKKPVVLYGLFGMCVTGILTLLVVVGSSNAVNLADGLDGLAAGCLLFTAFVLAVIAFLSNNIEISRYLNILYIEGSGEIGVFLSALIGACLGFLWYNSYPAQVFMGDVGSLSLGGILGVSAVLLRREFLYALVAGVFVIETLSVILQVLSFRYRGGKRIFLCTPLHHHFECKGWPETKIVFRFWMVGMLFALLGLASLKLQ